MLLTLLLLMPLTACTTSPQVYPADPHNECRLPERPQPPITDKDTAIFITRMGERIDLCQALLGR